MNVILQEVTRANWREALALELHPEQQRFVADVVPPVAIALAKAYIRPGGIPVVPYAVYSTTPPNTMVGFFNLAYEPDSVDTYWIFHFFIDRRFQGQGYGRAALQALRSLLNTQHSACRMVHLTVNPDNHAAQHLYTSFGFVRDAEDVDGEWHYRLAIQ